MNLSPERAEQKAAEAVRDAGPAVVVTLDKRIVETLLRAIKELRGEIAALQTEVNRLEQEHDENIAGEVADRLLAHLKSGERAALEAEIERLRQMLQAQGVQV